MTVSRWMAALAVALLACCLSGPAAAAQGGASTPNDRALLIGINVYRNHPSPRNLEGSVADIQNMRAFLVDTMGFRPDQIKLLTDEQATADNIKAAIQGWLIDGSRPGARVWFHYSGHGYQVPDLDGDEPDGKDEILVAHDVAVTANGIENVVLDDDMGRLFAKLADRQVTMVVDSCHSGTITRDFSPEPLPRGRLADLGAVAASPTTRGLSIARAGEEAFIANGNMVAWTAVSPNQSALEDAHTTPQQGAFTRRFLQGIRDRSADRNRDGVISYAELHEYVLAESDRFCKSERGCPGLTPTLEAPRAVLANDVVTGLAAATTEQTGENLLAHDNSAGVTLDVLPTRRVRLRETVGFRVTSQRDGFLLVLDVNANNQLTQIFPNRFSDRQGKSNRIFAGRPVTIPDASYGFVFSASEPVGRGTLFAIVTEDPVSMDDLLGRSRDLVVVADASAYMAQIAERLRKPWQVGNGATRTTNWSFAEIAYEITR